LTSSSRRESKKKENYRGKEVIKMAEIPKDLKFLLFGKGAK